MFTLACALGARDYRGYHVVILLPVYDPHNNCMPWLCTMLRHPIHCLGFWTAALNHISFVICCNLVFVSEPHSEVHSQLYACCLTWPCHGRLCCLRAVNSTAETLIHVQQGTRRKAGGASAPAAAMPSKPAETEYDRMSEVEVWLRLQRLLEVAKQKQGEPHNTYTTIQQYPHQQFK